MPTPTTTDKTRRVDNAAHIALLRHAFSLICDQDDWKNPVDALVPWEHASFHRDAVMFMTGTCPDCERVTGPNGEDLCHLTAIGYRAGPCN